MADDPDRGPTVLTNRALAVSQTIGFALLTMILAVLAVVPFAGAARRLSGVGYALVLAVIVAVLVLIVLCLAGIVASWRLTATIGPDGIRIRNLFSSVTVAWNQVGGVEVGIGASSQVVWRVATLIRSDSDRTVRVAVTYGRENVVAQAFADAVRAWAPPGIPTGDLASRARVLPPPVASSPVQSGAGRHAVRSWGSGQGSGLVTILLTFWAVVVALLTVVLAIVGGAVAAVVGFVIGAGLAWWFLRWTRPLVVVTPAGLLTRNGFLRHRIDWVDVSGIVAVEHLTRRGNRRRVVLTAVGDPDAADGVRSLWGTDRRAEAAQPVHERVMAFAPPTLLRPSP